MGDFFEHGDGTYKVTTDAGHVYMLQLFDGVVMWDYTVISTLDEFPPSLPADLATATYEKVV